MEYKFIYELFGLCLISSSHGKAPPGGFPIVRGGEPERATRIPGGGRDPETLSIGRLNIHRGLSL
jgi:hypothetical protein